MPSRVQQIAIAIPVTYECWKKISAKAELQLVRQQRVIEVVWRGFGLVVRCFRRAKHVWVKVHRKAFYRGLRDLKKIELRVPA